MITILIGTRTRSALRAAIDMAMADGRQFDVVAPRESIPSVHVQLIERNPHVKVWRTDPEQVKRGEIPLRIIAYAQDVSGNVFLACLNPQTDLILACAQPSKKSAVWLEELLQQEGKLEALRVIRLGDKPSGEEHVYPIGTPAGRQ